MFLSPVRVFSSSFDEATASAHVTIEGQIPTPGECDDPIVELFRPIRYQVVQDVFFTIIVTHEKDRIACTILPSNRRNRTPEELAKVTRKALLGTAGQEGVLAKYVHILEQFFQDEEGLKLFLEKAEQIIHADDTEKASLTTECNELIKMFVRKNNLEMPSIRVRKAEILKNKGDKQLSADIL